MSRDVIGPALKLARTVLKLTQQQAGEVIGISQAAAKNVFALYERGVREPGDERMDRVVEFIEQATAVMEQQQQPRQPGGIHRDAPAVLDDLPIGEVSELAAV